MKLIDFLSGRIKASAQTMDEFQTNIANAFEAMYPVGSVYMNLSNSTSPATLFGFGTWTRLKDTFVYALGDSGNVGDTGGSTTHYHTQASTTGSTTLTANQSGVPAHSHTVTLSKANPTYKGLTGSGAYYNSGEILIDGAATYTKTVTSANNTAKNASAGHTHTLGNTNTATSLPPYTKAYMWVRTA